MCHSVFVEVRAQFEGISSFLLRTVGLGRCHVTSPIVSSDNLHSH